MLWMNGKKGAIVRSPRPAHPKSANTSVARGASSVGHVMFGADAMKGESSFTSTVCSPAS
eukprot:1741296-Prymnesium_polylepis.1